MKLCQYLQPNLCSSFPGVVSQLGSSASLHSPSLWCDTPCAWAGHGELWPSGSLKHELWADSGSAGEIWGSAAGSRSRETLRCRNVDVPQSPSCHPVPEEPSFPQTLLPKEQDTAEALSQLQEHLTRGNRELLTREKLLVTVLSEIKIFILFLTKGRGD